MFYNFYNRKILNKIWYLETKEEMEISKEGNNFGECLFFYSYYKIIACRGACEKTHIFKIFYLCIWFSDQLFLIRYGISYLMFFHCQSYYDTAFASGRDSTKFALLFASCTYADSSIFSLTIGELAHSPLGGIFWFCRSTSKVTF